MNDLIPADDLTLGQKALLSSPAQAAAIDEVCDADRAWFEAHPDADRYLRHAAPIEIEQYIVVTGRTVRLVVLVEQLERGRRLRNFIEDPEGNFAPVIDQ
jgi:hypothetical protein